jgi:hypothetical protein
MAISLHSLPSWKSNNVMEIEVEKGREGPIGDATGASYYMKLTI